MRSWRTRVHRGIGDRCQRVKTFCLILGILRPVEWIFEIIFCILSSCHVLVPAFLFCNLGFLDYRYIVFSSLFCCTKIPENGFSTTTYSKHIQFSKFESSKKTGWPSWRCIWFVRTDTKLWPWPMQWRLGETWQIFFIIFSFNFPALWFAHLYIGQGTWQLEDQEFIYTFKNLCLS